MLNLFFRKIKSLFFREKSNRNYIEHILKNIPDVNTIVVFGRSSVGKSTFINELIDSKILETGVGGVTKKPTILISDENLYKNKKYNVVNFTDMKFKSVVDTPGIDSVISFQFKDFLNNSDLIIFITDCQQGLTKTDFEFLGKLKLYEKKLLIILNKIDLELNFTIKPYNEVIEDLKDLQSKIKNKIKTSNIVFFTINKEINEKYFGVLNDELYK